MKKLIVIILLFLCVYDVYALLPNAVYAWQPNIQGLMFKEYNVKTADGYNLKAWYYPAQKALSKDSAKAYEKGTLIRPFVIDTAKRPTIIICNGDACNMEQLLGLAHLYCTNGFNVITFDWRGFGESQYFPINTNYLVYPQFITDYNAIVDFTVKLPTVDTHKIGVFGFSTGAFLSFYIAATRPEIKAIVVRGLFTDYHHIIPGLKRLDPSRPLILPKGMDKYSPRKHWNTFTKPIFLIVGKLDKRTPPKNSLEILSKVKSNVRELWIVNKAGHGGIEAPEIIAWNLFQKKTISFFRENL
ncbi:alpha/beta hydrolase [Microbacter margulisiae]|uniref:Peptidase S9 prolyl oligopeptidase catalytic domain-containing protein n=1 Tax=Microbacter margulisiae TaxID=1350067 RepID=A0A7W5DQV0_9PORP|nr:alpha/beta fold hydrolase [Microbacter margulisiae]MBB3187402.1 hypothetical protein [Microbacter margulisiae]